MKAVLISVLPKWCKEILPRRKTVEVRKTKPNIPPPFKTYIYCTGGETLYRSSNDGEYRLTKLRSDARPLAHHTVLNGMVIAEFICDWCDPFPPERGPFAELALSSLVPPRELYEYAGGKTIYGWHISDLAIYDEPKEITDFWRLPCERVSDCGTCEKFDRTNFACTRPPVVTRPPQSWCYIDE